MFGTVSDADGSIASVTVNGQGATVDAQVGIFTTTLTGLLDGPVTITATATDDDGAQASASVDVTVDANALFSETKLLASDGTSGDRFGRSVAISGDVALVGAINNQDFGEQTGSAYIYRFDGTNWVEEQKLLASDASTNAVFGASVAIEGNLAVVGANSDDLISTGAGSVYIYRYDGTNWVEEQKLTFSGTFHFGESVSISGNVVIVGSARSRDGNPFSSEAYIYRYDGTSWVHEVTLLPSSGFSADSYGFAVSVSGNVAVIGAPNDNVQGSLSGSIYVYRYNGTNWVEEGKFLASDGTSGNQFGYAVSVSGDALLIGSSGDGFNSSTPGGAYMFRYNGTNWVEEQKLVGSDGAAGDFFGQNVSINGDAAVIGALLDDGQGSNSGSAYIFRYDGTNWIEDLKLEASDGAADDQFGVQVSINGGVAIAGARFDAELGHRSGSAYVYTLGPDNQPPVAADATFPTNEDNALTGQLDISDPDPGDQPEAVLVDGPTKGTLDLNPDGSFTYTPEDDFNGQVSFTYKATDGQLESGIATVTIDVAAVNDEPSFVVGTNQTVLEDAGAQTVAGFITGTSAGPADESGQTLTFDVTNDDNSLFSAQPSIDVTGELTYTPADNANGQATVTVILTDDGGTDNGGVDASAPQTFTIDVTPVNDAPTLTLAGNQSVNEDAGAQTVTGFATAGAGRPDESGQTLTMVVTNDNNPLFEVQPSIDTGTGELTYTPADDANGSAVVTVVLSDDGGTVNGGEDTADGQTFTISVNAVNDAPSFAVGANQTVLEDAGAQTLAGFVTDIAAGPADESGQSLTFDVTNDNNALFSVQPAIDATGGLTHTPADDANGSAVITVVLTDDGGTTNGGVDTSAPQTFTIDVTPVNDVPTLSLTGDQTINEDAGPQTVPGFATGSPGPPNESAQTLTYDVSTDNPGLFVVQPSIDASGDLTYTLADDANGSAVVTVVLTDDGGRPTAVTIWPMTRPLRFP